MEFTWEEFEDIYKHTKNNEIEIFQSKKCGCLFCTSIFDARKVNEWSGDGKNASAICPHCGMNTLIGDKSGHQIDKSTILNASNFIFHNPEEIFDNHPELINKYIECYEKKEIIENENSEALYKHFLYLKVTKEEDPVSAYKIAEMYEFGTRYTAKNYPLAINYYLHPGLKNSSHALARLGICDNEYYSDHSSYYTKVSKATALGSLYGICYLSDIYMSGKLDEKDPDFAFSILENAFIACFIETRYKNIGNRLPAMVCMAYRIGNAYEKGAGCAKDDRKAAIIYLIGDIFYKNAVKLGVANLESGACHKRLQSALKRVAKRNNYEFNQVSLDEETFFDSLEPFTRNNDMVNYTYTIPFPMLITIRPDDYDESSKMFSFTTKYHPGEPLIVDPRHLFCAFGEEELSWTFENVVDVNYVEEAEETVFHKVVRNEDSIVFYANDKGDERVILEVFLEKEEDRIVENDEIKEA